MRKPEKSKIFLATTALEEFWDTSQPILFLGDWCKVYDRKAIWENLDAETLESPLINQDPDVVRSYIDSIFEILLPAIAEWLNKVHCTDHSLQYWRILIGRFLFLHIQTVYDRYSRLKASYSVYPELNTIGLALQSYRTPVNIDDYYTLMLNSDAWHLQLFTQLIKLSFPPPISYKNYLWNDEITQCANRIMGQAPYKLSTKLKINFLWLIAKFRGPKTIGLLSVVLSKKECFYLMLASRFKILPLLPRSPCTVQQRKLLATTPNLSLRQELTGLPITDDFSKIILETLSVNLPLSFLENYKQECLLSKKNYPCFIKGAVGTGYGGMIEFYTAENWKKGMKRVGVHHGGVYGDMQSMSYPFVEHIGVDFYLAWGVKIYRDIITLPGLPFCQMLAHKNKKLIERVNTINEDSPIIWISSDFSRYPMPEIRHSLGANYYEQLYYNWQLQILSALTPNIFSKLVMRLRHTAWLDRWKYLKDQLPNLKIYQPDSKNSFFDHICTAKLLLIDNCNTTHVFGLTYNIPTIMFWDKKIWTPREEVKHIFEALEHAGILHHTPEAAAKMINKVGDDPHAWWESREVQVARQQYCDYFLRISPNWLKEWKEALLKIAKS